METVHVTTDRDWLGALADSGSSLEFTLYGFRPVAATWSYHDRTLEDHLLHLLTDGSYVGRVGSGTADQVFTLHRGSFLWMQPGVQHTFTPTESRPTLYHVRFRLRHRRQELVLEQPPVWHRDNAWDLLELMDQLLDELRSQLPYRENRLRALLSAICASELRHRHTMANVTTGVLSRAQRRAIETYLLDHLDEWPTPHDLADHVQLSLDYFSRLFTRTFGVPPRTWLLEERLRHGAVLLTDSLQNITEIAKTLGYDNVCGFSRQFNQVYGVGPRAYRQIHR